MEQLQFYVQVYENDTEAGNSIEITDYVTRFEMSRVGIAESDLPGNEPWTARLEAYGIADYTRTACFFWAQTPAGIKYYFFIRTWTYDPNNGVTAADLQYAVGLETAQFTDVLQKARPLGGRLMETKIAPSYVQFRGPDREDVINSQRGQAWGSGYNPRVNQGYIAETYGDAQELVKADTLDRAEFTIDNDEIYSRTISDEDPHTDVVLMTQQKIDATPDYAYLTPTATATDPISTERVMEEIGTGEACVVAQTPDGTWLAQWSDGFIDKADSSGGSVVRGHFGDAIGIWRRMYLIMMDGYSYLLLVRRDTGEIVATATAPFTYSKSDLTKSMETIVDTYPGPAGQTADRAFYKLHKQMSGYCGIWLENNDGVISISFCAIENTATDLFARQVKHRIRILSAQSGATTTATIQGYSMDWLSTQAQYDKNLSGTRLNATISAPAPDLFARISDAMPSWTGYNSGQPTSQTNYDYIVCLHQLAGVGQVYSQCYELAQQPNSSSVTARNIYDDINANVKFLPVPECIRREGRLNWGQSPGYDYNAVHLKIRQVWASSSGVEIYDRYLSANSSVTINNIMKPIPRTPRFTNNRVTVILGNYVNVAIGLDDDTTQRVDIWFGESVVKIPSQTIQDRIPPTTRNAIQTVMTGLVQSSKFAMKLRPYIQTTSLSLAELYRKDLEPPYDPEPVGMNELLQLNVSDFIVPTSGDENSGTVRRIRARIVPVVEYELEIFLTL